MSQANVPELADYSVVVPWPVQWGDQDAFGHVNNTVYFRWVETARVVYLEKIGLDGPGPRQPLGPILAAIRCNYRQQVTYPDTIHIGLRTVRIGRTSITLEHKLWSALKRPSWQTGRLRWSASTTECINHIPCRPKSGRPSRIGESPDRSA